MTKNRFSFLTAFACLVALVGLAFSAPAPARAAGVDADVLVQLRGSLIGSNALGSVTFAFDKRDLTRIREGVGAGQADKMFSDARSIAASQSQDLDLAGVLTDPLGGTLTFAKVKAIYIKAAATNTNSVVVGGAASNAFVGPWSADATTALPPGGVLLLVHGGAGWPVTASTGDLLKIANSSSGSAVAYDIIIIGTST